MGIKVQITRYFYYYYCYYCRHIKHVSTTKYCPQGIILGASPQYRKSVCMVVFETLSESFVLE